MSIIKKLNDNNWSISNKELNESIKTFLSMYGKPDSTYSGLANDEELLTWSNSDNSVTINAYKNKQVSRSRASEGEARGNCEIIENGNVAFSFIEYLNPKAAIDNENYYDDLVSVDKNALWLKSMYLHAKQEMNKDSDKGLSVAAA